MPTRILNTTSAHDYVAEFLDQLSGAENAGDGAVSRDALITSMKAFMTDNAQIEPILSQILDLIGQVGASQLTKGQALTAVITNVGTGDYAVGDKFTVDSASGTGAFAIVTAVDGSGVITGIALGGAGTGYAAADTATTDTSATGSGDAIIEVTIATNETKLMLDVQEAFA